MTDWVFDNLGWFVAPTMALIVGLLVLSLVAEMYAHKLFMAECVTDRPQYECIAMWRGARVGTSVVPMTIPVR